MKITVDTGRMPKPLSPFVKQFVAALPARLKERGFAVLSWNDDRMARVMGYKDVDNTEEVTNAEWR